VTRFAFVGTVGSGEVVNLFPLGQFGLGQFGFQVDIGLVAEKLLEFLRVGPVGSFDFAVELRRAGFAVPVHALRAHPT
jgi:hypothetical protein